MILLLALLTLTSLAHAESIELDAVVVRDEETSQTTINQKALERKQAADLSDVFRGSADVTVGGGSQRAAQKIYVRGLEDTQLNVTVDGARQGGYLFHHQGRLSLDPELLKQVSVEEGTGNALAGPGALGGAIRFELKDVEDLLDPERVFGGQISGRYFTNNEQRGMSLALFGRPTARVGLLAYGTLDQSENYRAGEGMGRVLYSASKPRSGLVRITVRPDDRQKVTLSTNLNSDNATRLLRANFGATPTTPANDQEFKTRTHSLNYDFVSGQPLLNLKATAYLSDSEMAQLSAGARNAGAWRSYGFDLRNTFDFESLSLTTGADHYRDRARSTRPSDAAEEVGKIFGVYAQAGYRLTELWRLSAGARFDSYVLDSVGGSSSKDAHVSPNIRTSYQWTDWLATHAGWSQAFRGAVPAEAYTFALAKGYAPADGLKGTVADTIDVGAKVQSGRASLGAGAYWTKIQNSIDSSVNSTTGILTRKNATPLKVRGLTLGAGYDFGVLKARGSFAYNKTDFGGQPLTTTSFNRGTPFSNRYVFGLDYAATDSLALTWDGIFVARLKDVPAGAREQPGYGTHDLSANYSVKQGLRVGLSIKNIFDHYYVAQGTAFTATPLADPGRDFRLSATVSL